ncbi:hypothetical protein F2Q68_00012128 [Brassica cretica]|uniref:Uncharacterized protein n=1 Tax=Brassica cretica TaxID=69181 RepID=A0A8S9KY00_BRACR|nr:hypothetical protein F2Q68_00012128 [Brassica cretica]
MEIKARAATAAAEPLDSLQVMYGNSDDFFLLTKAMEATSTLKLTREDEFSSLVEIKEYADCSQGPIPQLKKRELVYLLSVGYMRNHNTVGGLGEEALFPVYWNEYNWPVLTAESPETVTDHLELPYYNKVRYLLLERTRPRTEEIVRAQIKGLQRRQIREDEFSSLVERVQIAAKALYHKNHNTVGGLGEEALFSLYWNGDNLPVLRVQKLLPITWNFHIITRSGAEEGINPLILQSLFTGEDDTWKSWLNAVMPALLNLRQFSKIF